MLKDLVIETRTIHHGTKSFEVKGVTLKQLGFLIKENFDALNILMEGKVDWESFGDTYPDAMATIIAISSGELDQLDTVKNLPFTVQLEAFEACWDLTIPDYKALGKLIARIKGIIPTLPERAG